MNRSLNPNLIACTSPVGFIRACSSSRECLWLFSLSTVLDDYENADLVIIARIKSFAKATTPNRLGSYISHATIVVDKVFKGDVKNGDELTFAQGDNILGCRWEFYEEMPMDWFPDAKD